MRIVIDDELDILLYVGKKIWMMGYSEGYTSLLNPFEVFLYVENDSTSLGLTLVKINNDGDINSVIETSSEQYMKDDGDFIFLAASEDDLFKIPKVVEVHDKLKNKIFKKLIDRLGADMDEESLFFEIDSL